MGKAGSKRRKPRRRLPKVQGDPGRLWSADDAVPYAYGDRFLRSVGRAGPNAQRAYFRNRPGASLAAKLVGVLLLATVAIGTVAIVLAR